MDSGPVYLFYQRLLKEHIKEINKKNGIKY